MQVSRIRSVAFYDIKSPQEGAPGRLADVRWPPGSGKVKQSASAEPVIEGEILRKPGSAANTEDVLYQNARRTEWYNQRMAQMNQERTASGQRAVQSYLDHAGTQGNDRTRNTTVDYYV